MNRLQLLSRKISNIQAGYFKKKELLRTFKTENSFTPDQSKLKLLKVNLRDLVPTFFSNCFQLYELDKNIVEDKSHNHIENSYIMWEIKIGQNLQLKNTLTKFNDKQVRIGRVLQIMDSVAGFVGYRHCFASLSQNNPCTIVTGSVDSFRLFDTINTNQNMIIQGFINYAGKTSMQIQINLFQGGILKTNTLFMMISRNSQNLSLGYNVPSIKFCNLSEIQKQKAICRQKQGQLNVLQRRQQMKQSYDICPPSPEDIKFIHSLYLSHRKSYDPFQIPIRTTLISNSVIMHSQQRNIHGKIFGGFLMRELVQAGWLCAKKFFRSDEFFVEDLTNIFFKKAVEIGTVLRITAQVSYAQSETVVITVQAYTSTYQNSNDTETLSCYLHMILGTKNCTRKMYPETYEEALRHLSAKKALKQMEKKMILPSTGK